MRVYVYVSVWHLHGITNLVKNGDKVHNVFSSQIINLYNKLGYKQHLMIEMVYLKDLIDNYG